MLSTQYPCKSHNLKIIGIDRLNMTELSSCSYISILSSSPYCTRFIKLFQLRSSLLWVVTHRMLVVIYCYFGQPICPIFKGQGGTDRL
jgi:hypothetical protein